MTIWISTVEHKARYNFNAQIVSKAPILIHIIALHSQEYKKCQD